MLDDAGPRVKFSGQHRRLPDRAEGAVENQVALIGPEWRAIVLLSHADAGAQGLEEEFLGMPPERDDFHRQRPVSAEGWRQLTFIDNDDLPEAGLRHDLLVEQRTTATLDEIQLRIHLVGTIDGQVHGAWWIQGDGNAQRSGLGLDQARARKADDVAQPALAQELADASRSEDRRAPGAQTHDHARLHIRHRSLSGLLFLLRPLFGLRRYLRCAHNAHPFPCTTDECRTSSLSSACGACQHSTARLGQGPTILPLPRLDSLNRRPALRRNATVQ